MYVGEIDRVVSDMPRRCYGPQSVSKQSEGAGAFLGERKCAKPPFNYLMASLPETSRQIRSHYLGAAPRGRKGFGTPEREFQGRRRLPLFGGFI